MNKFLVFFYIALALFAFVQADVCNVDGHTLKVGETYANDGKCQLLTCTGPNALSGETCPDVQSLSCTSTPQDNSKPYPDCCPQLKCQN